MKTIIISLLLASQILAAENAVKLRLGDLAPFSGFLITKERVVELDKAERKVPLLEERIKAENDRTELYREDAREAKRELSKEQFKGNMKVIGAFVLGVIVTGFAFKLNKNIQDL